MIKANDKLKKAIQELQQDIESLSTYSKEIMKINNSISKIANQTNMLALNATIEAAHAGEYGKGFEIIAQEIRKLSDASKNSSIEIKQIIKNISEIINELEQDGVIISEELNNKG